jgi:hypothetical protein
MFVVGVILLALGIALGIPFIWAIGLVLAMVGSVLFVLGTLGQTVGGRRHYW